MAHFVQNKTTIILPGDTRGTTILGAKLEAGDTKCVVFFTFCNVIWLICKSPFMNISCHLQ